MLTGGSVLKTKANKDLCAASTAEFERQSEPPLHPFGVSSSATVSELSFTVLHINWSTGAILRRLDSSATAPRTVDEKRNNPTNGPPVQVEYCSTNISPIDKYDLHLFISDAKSTTDR